MIVLMTGEAVGVLTYGGRQLSRTSQEGDQSQDCIGAIVQVNRIFPPIRLAGAAVFSPLITVGSPFNRRPHDSENMALFKGENRHESISMVIGSILLVVGLIVLFIGFYFAFTIVSNPRAYLDSQTPSSNDQTTAGPRAEFRFTINDLTVSFQDASQQGDSSINQWQWDFGDGGTGSGQTPPSHTYGGNFSGSVRLTVRDGNDKESSALGNVHVGMGEHSSGNSAPDFSTDLGSALNMNDIFRPLTELARGVAAVAGTFFMLLIICIAGGSILKAGWNLIRPRPETIKVRIKPKDLQAEPVYPTTYATSPQVPMQTAQQPPPPFFPPETPPPQQYFQPPPPVQ